MDTTTKPDIKEIKSKAEKLHALAVRGIDGEKTTAKHMLKDYVNRHKEVLGALYPDYLSKRFKGKYNTPIEEEAESIQDLYKRFQEMERMQSISCEYSELPILIGIAKNMQIYDLLSIHRLDNGLAVFITCKVAVMKVFKYRFHIYRQDFSNYMENLTFSYLAVNGLAKGNDTPGNMMPFYKTCIKEIKPIKF